MGHEGAQACFHFRWIFFGNHATVEFEGNASRHDVGVGSAFNLTHIQVGVVDSFDVRADVLVKRILSVQGIQNVHSALQGVNARVWNGGVGHLAVNSHFHLQAAVVGGNDLVAKPRGDHQVRVNDAVLEQPSWADFSAEFFVISEQQLHTAVGGFGDGLERTQREGVSRKIAFANSRRAAIHFSILDVAAIRVVGPSFTRGNDVAVGVQKHGGARAEFFADQQVSDTLHSDGMDFCFGDGVFFNRQAHGF